MGTEDERLAALAEHVTDPDTPMPAGGGHVLTGAAAAAHGRAFLLEEYGSEEALERVLRRAGRKASGVPAKGASPTVRGRIPAADFAEFKQLEELTGKNQSELVREAVQLLLAQHRLSA